jgi:MerR family transcriptional regulator/heat shock protein HspR
MVGCHAQTLRYYEKVGFIEPSRSSGNIRLYSMRDIVMIQQAKSLIEDLGVNLAGVEVILRMRQRMVEMERAMRRMEQEIRQLREAQRQP